MKLSEINSFYTYLQSQQTSQQYLLQCYRKLEGIDAETKSYENCSVFMYYLEHGKKYYEAGKKLDTVLRPVMFFYGMAHLIKAFLLTKRPDYPESTSVLSHGVSTRKRKKKNYSFMEDEVKVQHNGLFPYFSQHLFNIKKMPFEKITMESLFSLIPELLPLYNFTNEEKLIRVGVLGDKELVIPKTICDHYHLTEKALLNRLEGHLPAIVETKVDPKHIYIKLKEAFHKVKGPFLVHMDQSIFLSSNRDLFYPISEIMVHYLLLYNLSMLSRYEAEWWGELLTIKPDIDFPFISEFLQITHEKIPMLIGKALYLN